MKDLHVKCYVLIVICFFLISSTSFSSEKKQVDISSQTVEENFHKVIDNYYFISDFRLKPSTRAPLNHYFWRYPIKAEDVNFEVDGVFWNKDLFPVTEGEGLIYQHLNRARIFYHDKNFERARNTLLSAKARAESDFKYLNRINYFIALTFLAEIPALESLDTFGDEEKTSEKETLIKKYYSNASNFLVHAFYTPSDDPLIQKNRIKALYNIAVINFKFKSYMYAYKFINLGLEAQAKEGSLSHYIDLLRMQGCILQKSRSYFDAIKVYDLALRQESITRKEAALILTQAANIYFDLNNYELAEDLYEKASLVDLSSFTPLTYVLRGEALFWMNELDKALEMFKESEDSKNFKRINPSYYMDKSTSEFVRLRTADIYLAKKDHKKASLEYFKVKHADRQSYFGQIGDVREACLDFHSFDLKNISHSRELFENYYNTATDANLKELALACLTMSYKDTDQMVEKASQFLAVYPESDYLDSMKIPLIKKQASIIDTYFKDKKYQEAVKFFETNRSTLFNKIEEPVRIKLFEAYMDLYSYDKAREFYEDYFKYVKTLKNDDINYNLSLVRLICFYRQIKNNKNIKAIKNLASDTKEILKKIDQTSWSKTVPDSTYQSYIERLTLKQELDDLRWMIRLVNESDSSKIADFKCNYTYDVYKVAVQKMKYKEHEKLGVGKKVEEDMGGIYDLIKSNETCSEKLVDIDRTLHRDNIDVILKRCQSYTSMSKHMAFVCWNEAQAIEQKDEKTSQNIYKNIISVAPKDSQEVSLSTLLYRGP